MNEERKRILQLLAEGQITAEEAEKLLGALLETDGADDAPIRKGRARLLRIHINQGGKTRVRVNLPLALARFALKFIPEEELVRIGERGIDLDEVLNALKGDVPDGKLVEIHDDEEGVDIVMEVV